MSKPKPHFKNTFLTGVLTVVPLTLTLFLTVWLFNKVTGLIPIMLGTLPSQAVQDLLENPGFVLAVRIVGLGLIVFAIYFVGLIAKGVLVRQCLAALEGLVERLPMVGTLYSTIKQMGNAILRGGGTGMFKQAVLLEYPRKDSYVLGFLTAEGAAELEAKTGQDLLSIFVPTTPNPTSGFLLMLPRQDVTLLDMTVMEAMRLVISGGAVQPPWTAEAKQDKNEERDDG
ncbi:MAG: DUF502 domain-containing protein [Victivallales bacterium]|jgi:uncharacterized membrane protein|nr:DUF502 domain-containing protein [Victivallales bacterium]